MGDYEQYWLSQLRFDKGETVFKILFDFIFNDLRFRYRPSFYIETVFSVFLFGLNWFNLFILRAVICTISMIFLYSFSREIGCNMFYSALFPIIVFFCSQGEIIYNLCAVQDMGLLFTSATLYFMTISIHNPSNKIYDILFILSFIGVAISFESFVAQMPFIIILYIILFHNHNSCSFYETIRFSFPKLIIMSIITVLVFGFIILTLDISGGVFGAGVKLSFKGLIDTVIANCYLYAILIIILLVEMIFIIIQYRMNKKGLLRYCFYLIIIVFSCLITLLLNSKSIICVGRYAINLLLSLGFAICVLFGVYIKRKTIVGVVLLPLLIYTIYKWGGNAINAGHERILMNTVPQKLIYTIMDVADNKDVILLNSNHPKYAYVTPGPAFCMQMILEKYGYYNGYLEFDGKLIDVYEKKEGKVESTYEWLKERESFVYRYFDYYSKSMSVRNYDEADVVVLLNDEENQIIKGSDNPDFFNGFDKTIIGNYSIYFKK